MSEEVTEEVKEPEIECSICGRAGGPREECELCSGNPRFVQSKAYTRTEEQRGAKTDPKRYDRTGNVNIKIIKLPGSWVPGSQQD